MSDVGDQIRQGAEYMRAKYADPKWATSWSLSDGPTPVVVHDHASYGAPMHMPMGTTCAVHVHREWVPIEQHHIWPKGMGGPDVAANKVAVCANGHYSIHEVIRRLIANDGALPDSQHFSAKVRALGMRGWTEAGKPTHGGGGE